jgi:hypothetical protein
MQPPLFPGRNPDSGTDPILDLMLADALPQDEPKGPADTTRPAREFAREHGWPVPVVSDTQTSTYFFRYLIWLNFAFTCSSAAPSD